MQVGLSKGKVLWAMQGCQERLSGDLSVKTRPFIVAIFMSLAPTWFAVAQSAHEPISRGDTVPRLGEIMRGKQWGHIKLWFAGKERNWSLAGYELAQIRASLAQAASLYSGIPIDNVAIMAEPIRSIDQAIQSKDSAGFGKAFKDLTTGCNACHRKMGREFIEIAMPKESPFRDQVFAPSTIR
ncbi:hypothetical protein [Bradyrhizobium sp.]|uniref:hypothetical protein n=1 Tax=Bradyrhizobium sp. TaxID=376 RepID=UPI001C286C70|nr:hypothetical protein [Bradyrhizobium sp.]MBU6464776.1 hypothetical protein [Pseudomonadota bacterium]